VTSTLDRRPSHCCAACYFDGHHLPDDQHCRTSDLELTATCCDKLRLSTFKSRLKTHLFLLLSANYSTYLFRQRLCSRLTALWRYITLVLLLLLLLLLSITVLQTWLWEKLSAYYQIAIKNPKRRRDGYHTNFYVNFHLKDDLRMKFIFYSNEMMQEGALTSFALHDLYCTNKAHEQQLTSEN